ncbi:winged helix-turn-helix domain-containing protein [Streptosporangium sp. NPDC087985]|uniref:winged helix-turn-helix domain-containing protein n=1 Tax=Streptosporangium sp. NPDC087985 TaxID=3366196 RepID=UPI0037F2884F
MIEFRPDRPRWEQVADILRERINARAYKPGQPIPGISRMQQEFGIARMTADKVVKALQRDGLIYTVPNLGSFVADPETGGPPDEAATEPRTE